MNSVDNLSLILQALSLQILFRDFNNVDLMQELQKQDSDYLEKILEKQNEIIELLKKGSENVGETITRKDRKCY